MGCSLALRTGPETAISMSETRCGPDIAQNMDALLNACSQRSLTIRFTQTIFPSAPYSFSLAQYDLHSIEVLKTKLGQFPRGTIFVWSPSEFSQSAKAADFFKELSEFATQQGIELQRAPASPPSVNWSGEHLASSTSTYKTVFTVAKMPGFERIQRA
jgi:hypothetical protein